MTIDEADKIIKECYKFCYFTRDKKFQKESINELNKLKNEIISLKEDSIKLKKELSAKNFLGMEILIESIINELKMWIALKENKPDMAWNFLIDAQDTAKRAYKCCGVFLNLNSASIKNIILISCMK